MGHMDEKIGLVRNGGIDIVLVALPGMKCNFFTGITGCPDFVFQAIYIPGTAYAKTVGNVFATVPAKNNWLELETCACMPGAAKHPHDLLPGNRHSQIFRI